MATPTSTRKSKTSTLKSQETKTIAEMVAERKHNLDKAYIQNAEATVKKVYDTAVELIEKVPVDGDIGIIIDSNCVVTVGIINSDLKPTTITLPTLEGDFNTKYMNQKFMKLLEKMLNTQGFHKYSNPNKNDENCTCYCTII